MSANRDRFANRLRRLRQERGFAAARHFAQALGIPENRYTRYERGDSEPDLDDLYLFFEHLPASPNELFGVEGGTPSAKQPPGFESGPQEPLERFPEIARGPAHSTAAEPPRRSDADAAAWHLATIVTRHRRPKNTASPDHLTFAELRDTGLLFKALRNDPFSTLSGLVTTPENAPSTDAAVRIIEQAIAQYIAFLE